VIPGISISEKTTLLIIISFNRLPPPSQSQQWEKHPNFLRQTGDLGSALVLGVWGCEAFGNDPYRTAVDFRQALETEFNGAFFDIVFAITDWSPERRFLGPVREVFLS
jgi:hypothetical protein